MIFYMGSEGYNGLYILVFRDVIIFFLFRLSGLLAVKIAIKVIIYFLSTFTGKNINKFNGIVK